MYRYVKKIGVRDYISPWKSKRLSDEIIKLRFASNNILDLSLDYLGTKTRLKFNISFLKQDKITFNHWKKEKIFTLFMR